MKTIVRQALLWGVCLALLGGGVAAAEPTSALTEGTVYVLKADELAGIMDEGQSEGVVFGDAGLMLREGALSGAYVSRPITMDEFSRMTVTVDYSAPEGGKMPVVRISVYRPEESGWGEWILLPDGETAGRTKGAGKTVLIRYQLTLTRTDATQESPTLRSLVVSAGEPFLSSANLIMLIVMATVLFLFLYRKKLQRTAARR